MTSLSDVNVTDLLDTVPPTITHLKLDDINLNDDRMRKLIKKIEDIKGKSLPNLSL